MATKRLDLTGTISWAYNLFNIDEKYANYKVNFYPDETSLKRLQEEGTQLHLREDDNGKFYILRREDKKLIKGELVEFGPPAVSFANKADEDKNIGNGSGATVRLEIYDTKKGKGTRLEAVRVDNLVEYISPRENETAVETPSRVEATPAKATSKALPF